MGLIPGQKLKSHLFLACVYILSYICIWIAGSSGGKASAYNSGDLGSIPGSGRSPGEGNGYLLQYSCLGNPMDGGAW